MKKNKLKEMAITAKEFDDKFERNDEDILEFIDVVDTDGLPPPDVKRKVSAELPTAMVREISQIAKRTGNSQNATIRNLLDESLERRKRHSGNDDLIKALSVLVKQG